jgi:hypothetical protein
LRRAAAGLTAWAWLVAGAAAQEATPPPAGGAPEDSASAAAAPDSAAAADSVAAPPPPPYRPDPAAGALASFRLDRSVDVEEVPFGEPDDPQVAPGFQTLADVLRLEPSVRTRELSIGPTAETFSLNAAGSGRADLLLGSRSQIVPGTSGPLSHEIMLSEISGLRILRGGGAALYGPDAAAGAVVANEALAVPPELTTRVFAEEGVDGYERAGLWLAHRAGNRGSFFLTTESRRVDGFFPGTKEVDRHFAARVAARVGWGIEATGSFRHYKGDGRNGGFAFDTIGSVITRRTDWTASLFRATGEGRGVLLEAFHAGQRIEEIPPPDEFGIVNEETREIRGPMLRLTADLPGAAGWSNVLRLEGSRWRIAREEAGTDEELRRGAAALRSTLAFGERAGVTGTARLDAEEGRTTAVQGRAEAWWSAGAVRLFGIGSRSERRADRAAAEASELEVHHTAQGGARISLGRARARIAGFMTIIEELRPDPTLEQIRSREPVTAAPVGDGKIVGADAGVTTERFQVPGIRFLGHLLLRSSFTLQEPERRGSGEPLPGRPKRIWTGEGFLERRLFQGDLLARVRGRLTHWGDRVDDAGEPVLDMWLTDVILEGEIGDAVFFYRFHDMLERADEVEPGVRFPGFTRTYGITWRFRG